MPGNNATNASRAAPTDLTPVLQRLREVYVNNLATALSARIFEAGCNWEVPYVDSRGPLSKLCFECGGADDDVAPADSQCCLAYDVDIDPRRGTERTLQRELDGRFCHRALWASCAHAVDPRCCDTAIGTEARFAGSWKAAHAACSGYGDLTSFGTDEKSRRQRGAGEFCPGEPSRFCPLPPPGLFQVIQLAPACGTSQRTTQPRKGGGPSTCGRPLLPPSRPPLARHC